LFPIHCSTENSFLILCCAEGKRQIFKYLLSNKDRKINTNLLISLLEGALWHINYNDSWSFCINALWSEKKIILDIGNQEEIFNLLHSSLLLRGERLIAVILKIKEMIKDVPGADDARSQSTRPRC
jgi:hypothetical protein